MRSVIKANPRIQAIVDNSLNLENKFATNADFRA